MKFSKASSGFKMDALLVLDSDGTLHSAHELYLKGAPIIGVPKTVDNDIGGTETTLASTRLSRPPPKPSINCIPQPKRIIV
jgi:hypothetical protein